VRGLVREDLVRDNVILGPGCECACACACVCARVRVRRACARAEQVNSTVHTLDLLGNALNKKVEELLDSTQRNSHAYVTVPSEFQEALCMGLHPRLGASEDCWVRILDESLVMMVIESSTVAAPRTFHF
jgi:hypothetical protein